MRTLLRLLLSSIPDGDIALELWAEAERLVGDEAQRDAWYSQDRDELFQKWLTETNRLISRLRGDDKADAEFFRDHFETTWKEFNIHVNEDGANVKMDGVVSWLKGGMNFLMNLNAKFGVLGNAKDPFCFASSTMLKFFAVDVYNKSRARLGKDLLLSRRQEPLERTILRCQLAEAAGRSYLDLPAAIQIDPQEHPEAYWLTKFNFQALLLRPGMKDIVTQIADALRYFHEIKPGQEPDEKEIQKNFEKLLLRIRDFSRLGRGDEDHRLAETFLAEAAREMLGCPRGDRHFDQPDRPSLALTPHDRGVVLEELRKKEERRRHR